MAAKRALRTIGSVGTTVPTATAVGTPAGRAAFPDDANVDVDGLIHLHFTKMSAEEDSSVLRSPAPNGTTPQPQTASQAQNRFIWDDLSTRALLQGLLDATDRGLDTQGGFKEEGWNIGLECVYNVSGKRPLKSQGANKLDSLKKTWKLWKHHRRDTLHWDKREDGLPQAPGDVMRRYFSEHKDRARFRHDLPPYKDQLDELLGDPIDGRPGDLATGTSAGTANDSGSVDSDTEWDRVLDPTPPPTFHDVDNPRDNDAPIPNHHPIGTTTPRRTSRSPSTPHRHSISASPLPLSRPRVSRDATPDSAAALARQSRKRKPSTNHAFHERSSKRLKSAIPPPTPSILPDAYAPAVADDDHDDDNDNSELRMLRLASSQLTAMQLQLQTLMEKRRRTTQPPLERAVRSLWKEFYYLPREDKFLLADVFCEGNGGKASVYLALPDDFETKRAWLEREYAKAKGTGRLSGLGDRWEEVEERGQGGGGHAVNGWSEHSV